MNSTVCRLLAIALLPTLLAGCTAQPTVPTPSSTSPAATSTEAPREEILPEGTVIVDLILFIGQSNMAGRGNAKEATRVQEGHAYEFRAISDPTKLYPLEEPFGAAENHPTSGVSENKKTGSMVSAFCEAYYAATGRPVVAVSCAKGGEKISFFAKGTSVYRDAVTRVQSAQTYLQTEFESGRSLLKLGNTYAVWLQGESDGDAATPAQTYTRALERLVAGFANDFHCTQTFVIPIGTYNGNNSARKDNYAAIRTAQIDCCADSSQATVISLYLTDLHTYGYMKDEFHFKQAGYEIIGKDAGANMAHFVLTGQKPVCTPYTEK